MAKLLKNRELLLVGAILVLVVLIAWRFPPFIAPTNLARVYNDTSILIILALGQMAVILTRCIDLSMAANLALSGMVAAMLNAAFPGLPIPVILLSAIALGAVLGMINGALVWKLDIPPIVVTLGTLTIYRGLIFLLTNGKWINAHQMSDAFKSFPRTDLAGIPVLSWLSVVTVAAIFLVISRTPLGRAFFAVGGNPHAAVYTGIDVGRTRFFAYCLSGRLPGCPAISGCRAMPLPMSILPPASNSTSSPPASSAASRSPVASVRCRERCSARCSSV